MGTKELGWLGYFLEILLVETWKKQEDKKKPETNHSGGYKNLDDGRVVIEALQVGSNGKGKV